MLILDYVDDVNSGPFIEKAAGLGNLEIAGTLLSKGADANAGMLNAVKTGHADLVRLMLSYEADATRPQYLSIAAANGNLNMVELLLANGATANGLSSFGLHRLNPVSVLFQAGYLAPYADSPKEKIAVGVSFYSEKKQVEEWAVEE